ncbi:MAG TPA: hypothetical protein VGM66_08995, partial [Candidatus Udaeobacter sp.]
SCARYSPRSRTTPSSLSVIKKKHRHSSSVKYWEIIADNLSKAGFSWGCVSALDSEGRTIWITDAHRGDGNRFVVRADEKLTAVVELERAIDKFAVDLIS